MGQAKRRGTFEERRNEAIIRRQEEIRKADEEADRAYAERQRKAQEWWDSLTPEQREYERQKRRRRSSGINAMALWVLPALMIGSTMGGRRRW